MAVLLQTDVAVGLEYHRQQLQWHCCVCTLHIKETTYKFLCTAVQNQPFWAKVDIHIAQESADAYPPSLCNNCYTKIEKCIDQKKCTLAVYKWSPTHRHTAPLCDAPGTVCRWPPKKSKEEQGPSKDDSTKHSTEEPQPMC